MMLILWPPNLWVYERVLFSVPSNLSAVIFHGSSVTGSQFTIYQTQFVKELEFCMKANRRVGLIKLLDASQGETWPTLVDKEIDKSYQPCFREQENNHWFNDDHIRAISLLNVMKQSLLRTLGRVSAQVRFKLTYNLVLGPSSLKGKTSERGKEVEGSNSLRFIAL